MVRSVMRGVSDGIRGMCVVSRERVGYYGCMKLRFALVLHFVVGRGTSVCLKEPCGSGP